MEVSITPEFATVLITELAIAAVLTVFVVVLGYRGGGGMGAGLLGFGAIVASTLCIGGTYLGYTWRGETGAWIGLVGGIVLAGIVLTRFLGGFIEGRSGRFVAGLWFGFCALCIFGYLAGREVGLLTITLPAIVLFWTGLYRASAYILPLPDKGDKSQRRKAFRSLLSFSMGTNYPYFFVGADGKPDKRVGGNPYLQFFAGPGIVYTDCEHAAYVSEGTSKNRVFDPGLSFTEMFDLAPKFIDLLPQLRAFHVEARTKDGIPIKVLTFLPFRIDTGGETVELGGPFPFRRRAIYQVLAGELVERKQKKEDSGEKHEWDGRLVPVIATRIVQDVISRYTVDELCAPFDPSRDPRPEIAAEIRKRVKEALSPLGLELIGGGISNLVPQDNTVIERRLDNWRTEWQCRMLQMMGEGEAECKRQIESARAEAETEIALRLSRIVEEAARAGVGSQAALALRFIDSLGQMVSEANSQCPMPEGIADTLKQLRGGIEAGGR
jgi:regulator of protease activity HflC (stomatin/prohibitin superfamily)